MDFGNFLKNDEILTLLKNWAMWKLSTWAMRKLRTGHLYEGIKMITMMLDTDDGRYDRRRMADARGYGRMKAVSGGGYVLLLSLIHISEPTRRS